MLLLCWSLNTALSLICLYTVCNIGSSIENDVSNLLMKRMNRECIQHILMKFMSELTTSHIPSPPPHKVKFLNLITRSTLKNNNSRSFIASATREFAVRRITSLPSISILNHTTQHKNNICSTQRARIKTQRFDKNNTIKQTGAHASHTYSHITYFYCRVPHHKRNDLPPLLWQKQGDVKITRTRTQPKTAQWTRARQCLKQHELKEQPYIERRISISTLHLAPYTHHIHSIPVQFNNHRKSHNKHKIHTKIPINTSEKRFRSLNTAGGGGAAFVVDLL